MKAKVKEIVVLALLALFGFVFWLSLSALLPKLSWNETALIFSAVVAALLFFILCGLTAMVVADGFWVAIALALTSYSGLLFFWGFPFLIAATAVFLAGITSFFRARSQIQKTLEGGIVRPLRRVLPLTTTALAVSIAVAAYQTAPPPSLDIKALLPEYIFARAVSAFEPTIKSIAPELQLSAEMRHTLYVTGIDFFEKQEAAYKNVFPIAFAIGFFAALRFFGFFLYWLAIILTALLLRILQKFGMVELKSVPRNLVTYSFS